VTWHADESYLGLHEDYHLDWENPATIEMEMDFEVTYTVAHRPFLDTEIEMEMEFSIEYQHSVALDLLRLIPVKYHSSQILLDYVDEVELEVGSWLTKVRDIVKLSNPDLVTSRTYLKNIAALIGLGLPPEDETTIAEIKRDIAQAIPWYKIKGTYKSIQIIALVQKFTVNLYDMYTSDYSTFYMTEWFVGDENENPPGVFPPGVSGYKSPHFGVEILLNRVYAIGTGESGTSGGIISNCLWQSSYLDNLYSRIEDTRPVHTVPHYILLLNPKTDESGHVVEVDGDIYCRVMGDWQISTQYFDQQGSGEAWNFDDGTNFDESPDAFVKDILKWKLGTGNYPCSLCADSGADFVVENPVLDGDIDLNNINISSEKITFEFVVPKSAKKGISELGLYTSGGKLVVGSCFPKIDLDTRVELRVLVEIYRKDLPHI
jgi:hypothetical protein